MPSVDASGVVDIQLDPNSWRALQRGLKDMAPQVRRELNKTLKTAGEGILADARSNASWSSRIPGSLSMTVTATRIGIKADRRKAPHARPYEGIAGLFSTARSFRHPLFGDKSNWFSEATRPFMAPAVRANETQFMDAAGEAVNDAARAAGWT